MYVHMQVNSLAMLIIPLGNAQRRLVTRMCMLHFLKNISREPIGYNTKIGTGGVEWGRVDIWIVL